MKIIKEAIKHIIPNNLMIHKLGRKASNSILLTFDDGPDEKLTPLILERLEEYQARAIFFVVGVKAKNFPHLIKMIQEKGHLIGNHTYNHPHSKLPDFFAYRRDIIECQNVIRRITGTVPILFRSPKGIVSPLGLLAARSVNLITVLWSNEGGEWGSRKSVDAYTIGKELVETLCPRQIVLLHDDNFKVPTILDIILPHIKNNKIDLYYGVNSLM